MEETKLGRGRLLKLCAFVCPAVLAVCIVLFVSPRGAIVSFLSDDAFYYLKIARNVVEGTGCTFDGIARTNGFHPLWMLYSIFIQAIAHANLELPALIIIATNIVLCCATLALLYGMVEDHVARGLGIVAVAAALLPNLLTAMLNGLETGLQIFILVLIVRLCYRKRLLDPAAVGRGPFALGLLLGLATLSRLDTVFVLAAALVMTVGAWAVRRISLWKSMLRSMHLCAGFGLAVSPYFLWNYLSFGRLSPISGTVKSTFPALRRPLMLMSDARYGAAMIAALFVLVAFIAVSEDYRKDRWKKGFSSPVVMISIASFAHFANVFFFMSWGVYWWHFTLYGLAIVMALVEVAAKLTEHRARFRAVARTALVGCMILAAVVMKGHELRIKGEQHEGWLRAAEWARENTSADDRFALLDAGLFGYFSERNVLNLDGKAGGYEYLDYLERGEVEAYLTERGIDYVANIRVEYVSGIYGIRIRRPNKSAVVLSMNSDWEAYRSSTIPSAAPRLKSVERSHFVIWKLPAKMAGRGD
jgi:hypothetical protein